MDKRFYSLKVEGNYKPSLASRRIMDLVEDFERIERIVLELYDLVANYGRMIKTNP